MPRPPLPVGTHGKITTYEVEPGKFRARCGYRHYDGKVYPVERYGTSRPHAERRLKEAIRDWRAPVAAGEFGPNSRFREIAMGWLAEYERDADRGFNSWGSVDTYKNRLTTIVLPDIGELRAHEIEASPVVLDRVCQTTRDRTSASTAKIVKSVIRNVCLFGVRAGAFETNPARDIGRIESKKARNRPARPRAMTADEVFDLLGKLDADEAAVAADLPDLVRLFLATGERTGEALAADWEDFDADAKQLTMSGNVIRATGRGKIINRGKTDNAVRPVPLADWCVRMLVNRHTALGCPVDGPIFPSSTGTIREASNVRNRAWNPFKKRAGYEWVTFRTFRKTVATLLDAAGLTARQIADILGHAHPSMTQDVYMGREAPSRDGANALHAALGQE
ncbi:site-specific integrase [Actinophytocola sp.]|uniref:tyrosine-type recombinase/integrase n=1 Tax=Actinophytocola sp. TaxID=1872138 RepID=UPI002D24B675|nr:site-specific integrase [Actinophytocola sp.]HYQ64880.1 site-specific integrase [Actinophytocola sp.]